MTTIYANISRFVSNPLKHPDPDHIQFVESAHQIPHPLEYDSARSYRAAIVELAQQYPYSIYEFALYAFRWLEVLHPQVYVRAALRDYHVKKLAEGIEKLSDALEIVGRVPGRESIFESRDRIAMPDETLYFRTGSDRDKALLLYTLLQHSIIAHSESVIGFSDEGSFVSYKDKWIDLGTLIILNNEPSDLRVVFNGTPSLGSGRQLN